MGGKRMASRPMEWSLSWLWGITCPCLALWQEDPSVKGQEAKFRVNTCAVCVCLWVCMCVRACLLAGVCGLCTFFLTALLGLVDK